MHWDGVIPISQVFGDRGNLGKLDHNTPNHVHKKSNPGSSAPHFASN